VAVPVPDVPRPREVLERIPALEMERIQQGLGYGRYWTLFDSLSKWLTLVKISHSI
jgi:hypothetical protein